MPIEAKICGITTPEAVEAAASGGAAYVGFIFFPPSPRHLTLEKAAGLAKLAPTYIKKVAVFVNPTDEELISVIAAVRPFALQLHGDETPARLREIREIAPDLKLIKAIPVRTGDDVAHALAYKDTADMLLFDAKAPKNSAIPGGTGLTFDWELLQGRDFPLPWFLSGGLNAENVAEAIRLTGATRVDVSSSVESAPGIKDTSLVKNFLQAIANIK